MPLPAASRSGRPTASGDREERIPVKGVRKMTAQAMVASAFTAPHVTEWVTVDVTATMDLVERLKADREFRDVKVTPLLVLAKAMCVAVRRNPGINASWDEAAQEIVRQALRQPRHRRGDPPRAPRAEHQGCRRDDDA
jgi:2-oxoisovalerate dehydrogenase E2 component (dihydrolipoyl transacylase)